MKVSSLFLHQRPEIFKIKLSLRFFRGRKTHVQQATIRRGGGERGEEVGRGRNSEPRRMFRFGPGFGFVSGVSPLKDETDTRFEGTAPETKTKMRHGSMRGAPSPRPSFLIRPSFSRAAPAGNDRRGPSNRERPIVRGGIRDRRSFPSLMP